MNAHSLEAGLEKSTNSIQVVAIAIVGTAALFSAMSLSKLGEVESQEEIVISKVDLFLPPPPPPPPPEMVTETVAPQVPVKVEVSLNPDPTKLTVSPIDTTMDVPSRITDRIEVSLTEFQRPHIDVDLGSIIFEKSEVDKIPVRTHTPMPTLPSKLKRKMGDARVIVQVSIDQKGKPLHVMVLNSPVPEAREYIVRDLKRWRFRPAIRDGEKVSCWARFVLVYEKSESTPFSL